MMRGRYIGPVGQLQGETALVMDHPDSHKLRVQFDNLKLEKALTHGWATYDRSDWEILPEEEE